LLQEDEGIDCNLEIRRKNTKKKKKKKKKKKQTTTTTTTTTKAQAQAFGARTGKRCAARKARTPPLHAQA
jgi:hypothetical protein